MQKVKATAMLLIWTALVLGVVSLGVAAEPHRTPLQQYQGQIRAIKIDRCDRGPGTCAGSMVLEQPRGRKIALAIQPGTWIERGDERVYLSELAIGNYVRLQAAVLPGATANPLGFGLEEVSRGGNRVGTDMGERTPTLKESAEP